MNSLEKKMVEALVDLKEHHHILGVKAEFEAEGTRMEEAIRLKEVVTRAGLDLTIKIGGCEALKDMHDAKVIGVNSLVAPMIESSYAMKKYIQSTKLAFSEDERNDIDFWINIETITGFNNIDSILELPEAEELQGIVLGRVDMAGSMGRSREDVNCEEIFNIANVLTAKAQKYNKKLAIGGGVFSSSLPFFNRLPKGSLSKFETRKIIFDADALADKKVEEGILKAVGFELMWLKNKRDFYGMIHNEDNQRFLMLESCYKKLIEEIGGVYA